MTARVYPIRILATGPRVERAELAAVVPMRTPWRSLRDMAKARHREAMAANARGDVDAYWSLLRCADATEAEAMRLKAVEERARVARELGARPEEIVVGIDAIFELKRRQDARDGGAA